MSSHKCELTIRDPYQFLGDSETGAWTFVGPGPDGEQVEMRLNFSSASVMATVIDWLQDALVVALERQLGASK